MLEYAQQGLRRLARIKTVSGARTSLFVPELDRLFVAARAGTLSGEAAVLVFRFSPDVWCVVAVCARRLQTTCIISSKR